MDDREANLVSSLTCSSMMPLKGELTNPLAFGFEADALSDKTLDKLNSFENLLPESQAHHSLRDGFPTLRFKKDRETLLQDVTPFPPKDMELQLFFSQFSFASRTTQGVLVHWFHMRIFSPILG